MGGVRGAVPPQPTRRSKLHVLERFSEAETSQGRKRDAGLLLLSGGEEEEEERGRGCPHRCYTPSLPRPVRALPS